MLAIAPALYLAGLGPVLADDFRELTIEQALQVLKKRGLTILYSSDLIQPWMQVRDEPAATDARSILEAILRPYELQVVDGPNGTLLLVRSAPPPAAGERIKRAATRSAEIVTANLDEVIVSASQYLFVREPVVSLTSIDADDLRLLPEIGDDPLRAVRRLPGTSSSDFSAKANVRGGEVDETLVRFDDLRLYNPFHLKDFQSTFSSINPGVVSGMRVHAGGFPVTFGDRMSSVIEIDPLAPSEPAYRELSLSFFSASALAAGRFSDEQGQWLVSARRGNLDLLVDVVNDKIGRPKYQDFYGRVGRRFADSLTVSGNVLLFDDAIALFTSDREEAASADYRDAYSWLRLDYQPTAAVSGKVLLAHSDLRSARQGRAVQEGIGRGTLTDNRAFTIQSLQSDWSWRIAGNALLQFGGEWRGMRGRYDYRDEAEFDVLFATPGASAEPDRERNSSVRPSGDQYAAYANLRLEAPGDLTADVGVRWEQETLSAGNNDQVSPRLGLLYPLGERTRLRASWGKYFQAQSVDELQIADGVTEFFAPQRSTHLVASIEHQFANGVEIRLEAYRKDYRQVRPRFENLLNTFVLLPELKPDRIRIAPVRANAQGTELTLRRSAAPHMSWWLSYSWSSVKDEFGHIAMPRSWDQTHLLTGGIAWKSDRWELSLAGTYHSGWPTTDTELIETDPIPLVATGPRNGRRLDDYRTLDARVARNFLLERAGTVTLFLELTNLLNRKNQCCVEYDVDEADPLVLDTQTRFYLPILPSLGFVWRF